jgi:hypothetical protein
MTGAAKQSAMPFRIAEKLPGFFCISRSMTGNGATGWFLEPWISSVFNAPPNLEHTAMTILALRDPTGRTMHDIPPALGIGSGVAFVAVSIRSACNKLTMLHVDGL